jgi:glutathione S-transferase
LTIGTAAALWGTLVAYKLVIGDKDLSSWSLRPWLAMRHSGIAFVEINIRLRRPRTKAQILRYAPAGKVPVLLAGGQTVWDSLAILEYLAEAHPQAGLWPRRSEARAHARCVAAEMHSGFAALREHCPMDFPARSPMAAVPPAVDADVRRIVALWADCRRRFGADGPFLFGAFTAADAMYAPVASRFRTYLPDLAAFGDDGAAQAYLDTVLALPAIAEWEKGARLEVRRAARSRPARRAQA